MRRLTPALVIALLILDGESCKRKRGAEAETGPRSMVYVADPRVGTQLLRGFHDVEENAWRWTEGKFTVALRVPAQAAEKGAALAVHVTLPEPLLARTKSMTLNVTVNGTALPPETFTTPGDARLRRDVPASALSRSPATVEFAVDNYVKAGELERRELGLIVHSIGFEAK